MVEHRTTRIRTDILSLIRDYRPNGSFSEALREVVANGMKYDMRTYCPKPISKQWLEEMSTEGVFEFYRLFIDLIGSKGGLDAAGPAVDCRFEEVPEGSPYYEKGKKVFLIMSKYEMFGPDGEVYCRKES